MMEKEQIIKAIDKLFQDTTRSPETTRFDLQEIRDRADEYIAALDDDMT